MEIKVSAATLVTNPKKCEMSREEAIDYARSRLEEVMSIFDMKPTNASITLWTVGEKRDPTQKVVMRLTYRTIDSPIIQEAHSRNIKKAIDRCVIPMTRQVRKTKTKLIDKKRDLSAVKKKFLPKKFLHMSSEDFGDTTIQEQALTDNKIA